MPSTRDADVIVVGAGNAGFCAALAAAERGVRVLMLEKAPEEWLGGNSYFTAGAIRTVHGGLGDVLSLVEPIERPRLEVTVLEPYEADDFRADMRRLTEGRADPDLVERFIADSRQTLGWLAEQGIPLVVPPGPAREASGGAARACTCSAGAGSPGERAPSAH